MGPSCAQGWGAPNLQEDFGPVGRSSPGPFNLSPPNPPHPGPPAHPVSLSVVCLPPPLCSVTRPSGIPGWPCGLLLSPWPQACPLTATLHSTVRASLKCPSEQALP